MFRGELIREDRIEKFEEVYGRWKAGEIGQRTVAVALGMSERTFRRYRRHWENEGVEGLRDMRFTVPARVTCRNHFVRHPAVVHEYRDGSTGVHDAQGRLVGKYDSEGRLVGEGSWKSENRTTN